MSARSDGKVVFELLLITVAHEVDAGVQAARFDSRVGGDTGGPFGWVVAGEVVDVATQFLRPLNRSAGIGAEELEVNGSGLEGTRARCLGRQAGRLPYYLVI